GTCIQCPAPLVLALDDDVPPRLLRAAFLSTTELEVRFSETMEFGAAQDPSAYLVVDSALRALPIRGAAARGDRVRLRVAGPAFAEALDGMALADSAEILLAIGLPVPLLQDEQQAQVVLDGLKQLKGEHEFSIGEQTYRLTIAKIKGLAQPAGTYINYAYDDALNPVSGVNKSEVLVLDIGMNTLDIYVLQNGQVLESFVGGDEVGVKRLLELMATNGRDIMELDALLRHGALKLEPAQLDGYLGEVLAAIKRTAPNLRRFDVVIPCGGGALVLGDRLKFALLSKGAKVEWPALPIETNVRGFWKYGMLHAK
ncbi:MAG: ParM/StbA family protein, partial [Chloroflexota bacterium]